MEKKLGIDWERNEEDDEAGDTSDRQGPMSVQTEQVLDGYADAQSRPEDY